MRWISRLQDRRNRRVANSRARICLVIGQRRKHQGANTDRSAVLRERSPHLFDLAVAKRSAEAFSKLAQAMLFVVAQQLVDHLFEDDEDILRLTKAVTELLRDFRRELGDREFQARFS
jgi:hypothetical protein